MSMKQRDDAGRHQQSAANPVEGEDELVIPGSAPPLGTERTDVNPGDEASVDELPSNDGETPSDQQREPGIEGIPDIDPDNAEMDDAPNPR